MKQINIIRAELGRAKSTAFMISDLLTYPICLAYHYDTAAAVVRCRAIAFLSRG